MKLFYVVWLACTVIGSSGVDKHDHGLMLISEGVPTQEISIAPSSKSIERRISSFTTKAEAIDFAEHTKYKVDCTTTPAEVYETVKIETVK